MRFNKYLPTPEVLSAWFGRYGRHVRQLHLRHLDAGKGRCRPLLMGLRARAAMPN